MAPYKQVLIHELLMTWGDEGFKKHISDICQFYKRKRDDMLHALQIHLTGELDIKICKC